MPTVLNWITCAEHINGAEDDLEALAEVRSLGIRVNLLDWQKALSEGLPSEGGFLFRTPWDYYKHFNEFGRFLNLLDSKPVMNPVDLINWNSDKIYLDELEKKGVPVFQTRFIETSADLESSIKDALIAFNYPETVVIKPAISAGSHDTFKVSSVDAVDTAKKLKDHARILVQPYAPSVETEGEFSVHFFKAPQAGAQLSHTIIKKPKTGDFRVQEKFGGSVESITPDSNLLMVAEQALEHLPYDWLYARVDCIRHDGEYRLAELEVFEPCLYFRFSITAPKVFAQAIAKWLEQLN